MAKYTCAILCALLALTFCTSAECALPSFRGYTGLLIIPTGDALNKGDFNAGIFSEDVGDTINDYIANYGLANGLEVGLNRRTPVDSDDHNTLFNAKYRFITETNKNPAVAAGIIDLTDEVETTAYIVASKAFGTPLGTYRGEILNPRIHVGFGAGEFSSLFAGVSSYVGDRVLASVEWDSEDFHAGLKFRLTDSFTLHGGVFDIGDDTTVGVGGSFGLNY